MNNISQPQQNPTFQITGIIQNYRTIITRTTKPMATFLIGGFSAKCFDVVVDTAAYWAATAKRVLVSGHLANHEGTIELVAQSINLAPAGQAETGFSEGGDAYISVQERAPIRETSTITENLLGRVSNLKNVSTRSRRPMITFKIGTTSCKAFGEIASTIQEAVGKHIEISARKGSFRGATEYTVEIVKAINGVAVDLRDGRSTSPGQHIIKTVETQDITHQQAEVDAYEQFLQREIESNRSICKVKAIPIEHQQDQPALASDAAPSQQLPTTVNTEFKHEPLSTKAIETATQYTNSAKSAPEPDTLVDQWVRRFRRPSFSDHELESQMKVGLPFVTEAAHRVLDERAKQREEANLTMEACF